MHIGQNNVIALISSNRSSKGCTRTDCLTTPHCTAPASSALSIMVVWWNVVASGRDVDNDEFCRSIRSFRLAACGRRSELVTEMEK